MDAAFAADTTAPPVDVYAVLADLRTYTRWLELVHRVEPAPPAEGDEGPAWSVDLRARLGPLARSKRLRMVRVEDRPHERVRFARREVDGRRHSPWELAALVRREGDRTAVRVDLHYGGGLWVPVLEGALATQVQEAVPRLQALLEAPPG